jgi:integral membrane sensor domain MASE1
VTSITSAPAERRGSSQSAWSLARRQDPASGLELWRPSQNMMLAAAVLIGIFALGWFSALTRPAEAGAAVWWPASGLAIGLGIRTPRSRLWVACVAVGLVLLGANLSQYGSVALAIASSIGAALEMAIGTLILRAGGRTIPVLATRTDLFRLVLAVAISATAYDGTVALTSFAVGDVPYALLQLFTEGPRRAAGMLLVAPLFMLQPAVERIPGRVLTGIQIGVALAAAALVFHSSDLPLAFLVIVPPVVGALWFSPRWLMAEMLTIAVIASYASANGQGPFSFARLGPTTGATLLQAFELTMATIVLVISLTVSEERRTASRAQRQDAEELKRAGEIQRALTPADLPSRPGWEHGAAAVSAREVGGDFYDLRIAGRFAAIALGDVMGKGAGAGILAAATRTALRASLPERRPADALADGVRIIEDDLRRSNAFVTLGYAVINLLTGAVTLADAGHGLSFVVGKDGREVERLATFDLPLGLGSEWSEVRTELKPGESLLMVSDGVLDRWGGSIDQLLEAIRRVRSDPSVGSPQELAEILCKGPGGEFDAADDATAVMFHRDGLPS